MWRIIWQNTNDITKANSNDIEILRQNGRVDHADIGGALQMIYALQEKFITLEAKVQKLEEKVTTLE